ncbi:MAG: M16 family metallopeptidase [Myxococcaceae bacterium]
MKRALLTGLLAASYFGCATSDSAGKNPTEVKDTKDISLEQVVAPPEPEKPKLPPPPPNEPVVIRPLQTPPPMTVILQPVPNKPIVSFRLVFRAGSVDDPPGQEGLTSLTADVMSGGGTKALTSAQLLEVLFPMAGELSSSTDKEFTTFSGRVHKDNLEKFFTLFTDVVLNPRMDPKEFERIRQDALNSIKNDLRSQDDESLGKVALDSLVFRGHPYGHYVGGTVQGLSAITLEDVKAQMKKVFTQDRLVIGLAGAVDQKLADKLKGVLSALPKTGAPFVVIPPAPGLRNHALLLQKDGLSTAISMGYAYDLRRGDPDYFAVALALSHLGEHRQFNGVLFNELREKRGMNYGDYAYAEHFIQEGWGTFQRVNIGRSGQDFSIWLRPVEPQNAVFATRGALYFLNELATKGMSKERFELQRGFLTGYTHLWEQTDERRLGYAIDDLFYGTKDFLESYRKAMATMTVEDVNAAVKRHLTKDKLNFVYVAQDVDALSKLLREQSPTPITYPTPKPPEVMELDKQIIGYPIPVNPAFIEIQPATSFMEK